MVASAGVIAMLDTLTHAAQLFGWTLDGVTLETTMTEARALNDATAHLNLRPTGEVFEQER